MVVHSFNNDSPHQPFRAAMTSVLREILISMETFEEWAERQNLELRPIRRTTRRVDLRERRVESPGDQVQSDLGMGETPEDLAHLAGFGEDPDGAKRA